MPFFSNKLIFMEKLKPATKAATACAVIVVALACLIAVDPLRLSVMRQFPEMKLYAIDPPGKWTDLKFGFDAQNRLEKAEMRFVNEVSGPECIAFDADGRGPYTGTADGRIMRWDPRAGWTVFAFTSPHSFSKACTERPASALAKSEHLCGRPLGLRFHPSTGDLYIADAYFGLMKVGPQGGLAESLCNHSSDGHRILFANDLDIHVDGDDMKGDVYFTDSSARHQRRDFLQAVFSTEASGRVLKYDASRGRAEVLVSASISPTAFHLAMIAPSSLSPLVLACFNRYWLKGPKSGTWETFAVLPGYADNVRTNDDGDFWVAMHFRRNWLTHFLASRPRLRRALLSLPISADRQYLGMIGGKSHGLIGKYNQDGDLVEVLEDKDGKVVRSVSHVTQKDGQLWMGSVLMSYIAVLNYTS